MNKYKPSEVRRFNAVGQKPEDASIPRSKVLRQAKASALKQFSVLAKIAEYDSSKLDSESARKLHVPASWTQIMFTTPDANEDYLLQGDGDFRGMASFYISASGKKQALITMSRSPELNEEQSALSGLAVLLHELGHVDDFSKSLYLVTGREIDIIGAEQHAHHYACRRLFDMAQMSTLAYYMAALERKMMRSGLPTIEEAARRVVHSPIYQRYRDYTFAFARTWDAAFPID